MCNLHASQTSLERQPNRRAPSSLLGFIAVISRSMPLSRRRSRWKLMRGFLQEAKAREASAAREERHDPRGEEWRMASLPVGRPA